MTNDISNNLTWSSGNVSYEDRCKLLQQKGLVVWFTGISGAGKSSIAIDVENMLINKGMLAYRLDGDNVRHGLCSDLEFSEKDRNENIRRIAELAALFKDVGIITLVSCISPYRIMRDSAKKRIGEDSFIEVYVKADLETCMARDPKGYYKKALSGKLDNFTALTSPYEEPVSPDLIIDTDKIDLRQSSAKILEVISKRTMCV